MAGRTGSQLIGAGSRPLIEVCSSAERLAFGGQNQATARRLIVERLKGVSQASNELVVEMIVRWTMNLYHGNILIQNNRYISILSVRHDLPF
jgi:hypothetical protein